LFNTSIALLAVREAGFIVGPIARLMGRLYNAIFNVIHSISPVNALGICIIVFTIVVKVLLLPLLVKQQKSSLAMQKLQPELDKIKKKYQGKKDLESQNKMSLEMQKLQKDNNVSMLGGCLPLLIQLPILYALWYVFQQPNAYVDIIGQNYDAITNVIMSMPVELRLDALTDVIINNKLTIDVAVASDIKYLLSNISVNEWDAIISASGTYAEELSALVATKIELENFLIFNLVSNPGLKFPGIIIPILAGGTTYIQTKVLSNGQSTPDSDNPAAGTMKTMNYMMPVMMGVMTIGLPSALGIYWTVSNVIQAIMTVFVNKYIRLKESKVGEAK